MDFKEYWTKRNEQLFLSGEKSALQFLEELQAEYDKALRKIELQLNALYGKYQKETGLDMQTIKQRLTKSELKDVHAEIKEYLKEAKDRKLDITFRNKLKLSSIKPSMTRLEELKLKIQFEIESLSKIVEDGTHDILAKTYETGYMKTIFNVDKLFGFSSSWASLNLKAIEKAISTTYMAENYSKVIWRNKENLLNVLNQQIPQGIILGYNPKKVAKLSEKKLKTNYNATVRLVRTEYNLILNDSVAAGYEACGIDKYELLATLDDRTSEICQEMDGKVFELDKREVGINYPPFHPNCRTTTIAYFDEDEFDVIGERIARDETGTNYYVPANITYKQWREGLHINDDGIARYQN